MNIVRLIQAGSLFLVGLVIGVHFGFYISSSYVCLPAENAVQQVLPPTQLTNTDFNIANKDKNDEIKEFMKKFPNPCFPLGESNVACLPAYIILGAMKAGTTFIDHYLQEHPRTAKHRKKEIFFFSQQHGNGIKWYADHFEETSLGDGKMIGEGTPVYLPWPLAPERMRLTIPNVRLIVSLRDPVERTYSQYAHSVRWLPENLGTTLKQSFEELLEEEVQLMRHCHMYTEYDFPTFVPGFNKSTRSHVYKHCWDSCLDCFPSRNSIHGAGNPVFGLLAKSIYYDHLVNWFRVFPRRQFLILKYEDIQEGPAEFMNEVLDFLDLEPYEYKKILPKNVNVYAKMKESTREKLNQFFYSHTIKLYQLLGTNFDWESARKQ